MVLFIAKINGKEKGQLRFSREGDLELNIDPFLPASEAAGQQEVGVLGTKLQNHSICRSRQQKQYKLHICSSSSMNSMSSIHSAVAACAACTLQHLSSINSAANSIIAAPDSSSSMNRMSTMHSAVAACA